jgi:hypothetical protein
MHLESLSGAFIVHVHPPGKSRDVAAGFCPDFSTKAEKGSGVLR